MARFSDVVITYFVLGAILWGAGISDAGSLGAVDVFLNVGPDTVSPASEPQSLLGNVGDTIGDVAGGLAGPILAVWSAVRELISVLFWPVVTLLSIGAPNEIVVLLGGTPTVAFFMGVLRAVRESA